MFLEAIEIIATLFGLVFLILIIFEKKIGWWFGIAGSFISIYLFFYQKLYAEAILYTYYVIIGFYGYYLWNKNKLAPIIVKQWSLVNHAILIFSSILLALGLGYVLKKYTDADKPYIDAYTTIFSFSASYLEAKKILSTWLYWIVINGVTIWLYYSKELNYYGILTIIYFIASFWGYYSWRKSYKLTL